MSNQALAKLGTKLSSATGRTGLILQKYKPEILIGLGITGAVASTVSACFATLKVQGIIDGHRDKITEFHAAVDYVTDKVAEGEIDESKYTEQDQKRDLTVIYVQTAVEFVKIYWPAITLGLASTACILSGYKIMRERTVALTAAYKALESGFKAYRERVVEELGEEKDYMFKNGLRYEEVVEEETDDNGKTKKVKKNKLVADDPNGYSQYARFFDDGCTQWSKTPEYNLMFLKTQQNYFNDMLQVRGHVFLNEVYDALGIPRTKAGQVVGWVREYGDGFIDFGIFDGEKMKARDFVNGYERSVLLDFNVDGPVYDMIEEQEGLFFRR